MTPLLAQIRPSKEDHIIFLGDYIDRGPDSKGVVDEVMRLQEEGYKVKASNANTLSISCDQVDPTTTPIFLFPG